MRLRHATSKKLLTAVGQLYSDGSPETLADRSMTATKSLISGEITSFDFFEPSGIHTGLFWNDPHDAISNAEYEIFANVAHEHPFSADVFGAKRRDTLRTSDYLSETQFHKTAIYNEFYRRFHIDHQLLVAFSPEPKLTVTCAFNRSKRNFTDEERLLMDLIAPHLNNAIRNGRQVERLIAAEASLCFALSHRATGVVSFNRIGQVLYMSNSAHLLLRRHYEPNELRKDGVPERLAAWVSNQDSLRTTDPTMSEFDLKLEKRDVTLRITLIFDDAKGEKRLLLEESQKPSPVSLSSLGLTRRQTEVLFWISQGKTDKDVSQLLGISPRTVHKHLENIYVSLGVETRTAAMSMAFACF
jgi:DNA-binding CsgD family transcriptional regulator